MHAFLSASVLHRTLAHVMIFARYFSRRCLHAAFADYLGALLFACHYHTLCSLADFPLFFLNLFSLTVLIYHFPYDFRTLRVLLLFWGFWAIVDYTFARTLQAQSRNSYALFTSRSQAIFTHYLLSPHFMFAFHSRTLWFQASHNMFARYFPMLCANIWR